MVGLRPHRPGAVECVGKMVDQMDERPIIKPDLTAGGPSAEVQRAARIAGLRDFETPSLEQVERRRFELLGITFLFLVVLAIVVAILPSFFDLPRWFEGIGAAGSALRALVVLIAAAFAVYVLEKERYLGRLSRALVNERVLSAALANRLKEISSLTEAGRAVLSILELEDVLRVILNAAFDLLEADEGSVLLVEGEELAVAAATGHAEQFLGSKRPIAAGLGGYVARNREPLLIEGKPNLEDFGGLLHPREQRIVSAMSVPLEAKGELLGVLNLNITDSERRFNEYDLRALTLFGEHAAMAIRHARVLHKERELRAQMVELDRIRAELVGSITHDLKTPLTSIVGSAKLLLTRFESIASDRREDLLESIEWQAQRLLLLIERLLEAARSQSSYPLTSGPVDLVQHVEALVVTYSSAHDRHIAVEKESRRVEAYGDPDAVEQIVANLLENAVKYTPAGTPIRIRLSASDGDAVIAVSDEGPGIPSEIQGRLFEPFQRGLEGGTGVGLGLFIVANLVRAMGGEVTLTSEAGRGATFRVTLPVRAGSTESPERVGEGS